VAHTLSRYATLPSAAGFYLFFLLCKVAVKQLCRWPVQLFKTLVHEKTGYGYYSIFRKVYAENCNANLLLVGKDKDH